MKVSIQGILIVHPWAVYQWKRQVAVIGMFHFTQIRQLCIYKNGLPKGLVHCSCLERFLGMVKQMNWLFVLIEIVNRMSRYEFRMAVLIDGIEVWAPTIEY